MDKANIGNFLEDFSLGRRFRHASPRLLSVGDIALYNGLFGARFAVQASDIVAKQAGYPQAPIDDFLVFHMVFGKSVPDISLNAVANLGYAEGRFGVAVYPGDTIFAESEVIGVKENSNGKTGTVYVHSIGKNQHGQEILSYKRWVMVKKRDVTKSLAIEHVPMLAERVSPDDFGVHIPLLAQLDADYWGSPYRFGDYQVGEKIDHIDGVTVEEAEHMIATRLYHNTAKVHFNHFSEAQGRFGKRLIYGGHVISLARALSFNGLAGAYRIAGINGGRHIAPLFAGDSVFAWSEVIEKADISSRTDIGAIRLRTRASKNLPCADYPQADGGPDQAGVILDFDYWVILPR